MNSRSLVKLALLAASAILAASCGLDYTLNYDITSALAGAETVTVSYVMTNAGSKSMDNVTLRVEVQAADLTPTTIVQDAWTSSVNLSVGETESGSIVFTFPAGFDYVYDSATIIGVGWDESDFGD